MSSHSEAPTTGLQYEPHKLIIVRDIILAVVMAAGYFLIPYWIIGLRLYEYNWQLFAVLNVLINFLSAWFFIGRVAFGYLKKNKLILWLVVVVVLILEVALPYKVYSDIVLGASHFEGTMKMDMAAMTISFDKDHKPASVVFQPADFRRFNEALCHCGQNSQISIDYLNNTGRVVQFECSQPGNKNMPAAWLKECR